jgi:enoyl-CoA hydratase/carnithine racemase
MRVSAQEAGGETPLLESSRGEGRVRLLTLNRPDRLNAVSQPLYEALTAAVESAERDDAVRALIVTGAGRSFCVGADLKAHAGHDPTRADRRRYIRSAQRAARSLQRCGKPIIAAVNGHAVGAGLELALACDLIVVAVEAKLRFPEVALGTFVGGGVTYTLPRRVGLARANELLMLAEFFTPADALAMGMVNAVVPAVNVMSAADDLAHKLVKRAPVSLRKAKRLLQSSARLRRDAALSREADALLDCMETEDWREGVAAFAERREPVFHGR